MKYAKPQFVLEHILHVARNSDFLFVDQGLPRWKTLQCRKWHGRPKQKNIKRNSRHLSKPFKTFNNQELWPPLPGNGTSSLYSSRVKAFKAEIPIWQEFNPSQNNYFKSGPTSNPYQFGQSNSLSMSNFSGNGSAAWMKPLAMGGGPIWGNQNLIETVRQAMRIDHQMPYM